MSHSLVAERRKRRLDRCGHPAFDLGESEGGARVEYHIRGEELAEVARCRSECGLPAVWDGRKWVKGVGFNAETQRDAEERGEDQGGEMGAAFGGEDGTTEDTDDKERE
jgi:hypothetical protein